MAVAMIGPKFYGFDSQGNILSYGKLYTFQSGTDINKATYNSEDQSVENTNPVILNGDGYADIYLSGSYKMVLKDSDDNEVWSSDPVSSLVIEEWMNCFAAEYISTNIIKITGNVTDVYEKSRKVRVKNSDSGYAYSSIVNSRYAGGYTIVTLSDSCIDTSIANICTSIVGTDSISGYKQIIEVLLGCTEDQVIYATDTDTDLDDVLYIFDADTENTYKIPTPTESGEKIVSLSGNQLTTTSTVYTITKVSPLSWGNTLASSTDGAELGLFELWLVKSDDVRSRPLPSNPPDGTEVTIRDRAGTAGTDTITIGRNGNTIENLEEDMTISTNYSWVRLRYVLSELTWLVIGGGIGAQVNVVNEDILNAVFPIGRGIMTRDATNPSIYYGGTWVAASAGLMIGGVGTSTDINGVSKLITSGVNSGEWEHTQTELELATHEHSLPAKSNSDGGETYIEDAGSEGLSRAAVTGEAGGAEAMNIANPLDGWYIWERTA